MKKMLLFVLFSGLFLNLLSAQDEGPGSVIKTNPFGLAFGNFNLATVLTPTTSSILKPFNTSLGGTNWSGFQRNITSASGYAQAVFNNGVGSGGITLTDPTKVLLAAFVISPGSQVSYAGTTVTVGLAGAGNGFSIGDGTTYTPIILTNAGLLQFTVVPEPSTIAMGLISGISLMATGFYRRRQVKISKSIV